MPAVNTQWKVFPHRPLGRLVDAPQLIRVVVSHHRMISARPAEVLRQLAGGL